MPAVSYYVLDRGISVDRSIPALMVLFFISQVLTENNYSNTQT